jgi:hypothetical protein
MARGEVPRSPFGDTWSDRIKFHLVRWAPLLVTAVVTYLLFPPPAGVGSRIPDIGQRSERAVVLRTW